MFMNRDLLIPVFKKDFYSFFKTPTGYIFLLSFILATNYLVFSPSIGAFYQMRHASLNALFNFLPTTFMVFVAAISMKTWAEERKSGTIELLMTLPVKTFELVLAKFFSSLAFISVALLLTIPLFLSLIYLGNPDYGAVFSGYLGSVLLASLFLSLGGLCSALTKGPVISFISSISLFYFLVMLSSTAVQDFLSSFFHPFAMEILEALNPIDKFEMMMRGVIRLSDLVYFVMMISFYLFCTTIILEEKRGS